VFANAQCHITFELQSFEEQLMIDLLPHLFLSAVVEECLLQAAVI